MAEAAMAEEQAKTPMSPALQATLLRARDYASSQSHLQVTVEHLLLALSEDDDAGLVLQSSQVDLNRLRNDVAGYLGNITDRSPTGGPTHPTVSTGLAEILKYATLAAKQGRRNRIDGAIVLAALVGDGRSMAASFLNAQGLTFEEAIRVLQRAAQTNAPAPVRAAQPAPQQALTPATSAQVAAAVAPSASRAGANAEDILAAARERVEQRTLPPREPRSEAGAPLASRATAAKPAVQAQESVPSHQPATVAAPEAPTVASVSEPLSPRPERLAPAAVPVAASPATEATEPARPPKLPEQPVARPAPVLAELTLAPGLDRSPLMAPPLPDVPFPALPDVPPQRPVAGARQPSSNWAPPPMPVPPPQSPSQPRLPPPGSVRSPMPPSPSLTERLADRPPERPPPRPEPTAGAPWPDPVPRPPQPHGAPAQYARAPAPQHLGQPGQHAAQRPGPGLPSGMPADAPRLPAIEAAQVSHALPKRLRHGVPATLEVRVARSLLAGAGAGPMPLSLRAEWVAARAITVRLRGAKGAFAIEPGSPETQWDQATGGAGRTAGDTAIWRFTVTPLNGRSRDLQLTVSARTIGADGMIADTVLPDQVLPVRVARNVMRPVWRLLGVVAIVLSSISVWTVIEQVFKTDLWQLMQKLAGH